MTKVKCGSTDCRHNKNEICTKEEIEIDDFSGSCCDFD